MGATVNRAAIDAAVKSNLEGAVRLLSDLIRIPSVRGRQQDIARFLKPRVERLADSAELVTVPDSLMEDPDYSFRLEGFSYGETANLRLKIGGAGGARSLAFNAHLDVVPETPGQTDPFSPAVRGGRVYGRGANDAKGQVATLWLALKALRDLRLRPAGDITVDFVVEEECGGNGTLLVVRNGLKADGCIVLEPTDLRVVHLVRGAVWFEVRTSGVAGHSGSPGSTVSALQEAIKSIKSIEILREELLAVSRRHVPLISDHPNPMPVTFGMLHSGNWPAAAPSEAVLKGVFGFLPPFHRGEIQERLRQAVSSHRAEVHFNMLNSDPSWVDGNHALVRCLIEAAGAANIQSGPAFMNASCDSWRYTEQLGIPAVVFGPGSISTSHGKEENVSIDDLGRAAAALISFLAKWSGFDHD
jgi:acetylornithine deacetylase